MQGDCAPGICEVLLSPSGLVVMAAQNQLWLANLSLVLTDADADPLDDSPALLSANRGLYLTGVELDGTERSTAVRGIDVSTGSNLYMQGAILCATHVCGQDNALLATGVPSCGHVCLRRPQSIYVLLAPLQNCSVPHAAYATFGIKRECAILVPARALKTSRACRRLHSRLCSARRVRRRRARLCLRHRRL